VNFMRDTIVIETDASGSGKGFLTFTPGAVPWSLHYIPDPAATQYGGSFSVVVTGAETGKPLMDRTGQDGAVRFDHYFSVDQHDEIGLATGARTRAALVNEKIKISVSGAGDGKRGTFHVELFGDIVAPN